MNEKIGRHTPPGIPKPNESPSPATPTAQYPSILNSIFKRLPGDVDRFHDMAEELAKDGKVSFKPLRDIRILDCLSDRNIPFFGRAFLSADNRIYICGNTTWKMFLRNDRRGLQNLLLHEMIHLYDRKVRGFNFFTPHDLACSEIRAYHMSSTCDDSSLCVFRKTDGSMSMSASTQYMAQAERTSIISSVLHRCMKDQMPFERPETPILPPSQDSQFITTSASKPQPTYPAENPSLTKSASSDKPK